MKESTLLKVSLACSLVGILIIIILSEKMAVPELDIGSISDSLVDKQVKIKGEIIGIRENPGIVILNIKDRSGSIKTVAFKEDGLNLNRGNLVEVTGKVKKFEEEVELEADFIRLF